MWKNFFKSRAEEFETVRTSYVYTYVSKKQFYVFKIRMLFYFKCTACKMLCKSRMQGEKKSRMHTTI